MANKKETKVEPQITDAVTTPVIAQERYENCEWCFQFDEDEPQVFAWTDETINSEEEPKINFTISNVKEAYITFSSPSGKTFKLFPRELSETGKQMRENSKIKFKTNE